MQTVISQPKHSSKLQVTVACAAIFVCIILSLLFCTDAAALCYGQAMSYSAALAFEYIVQCRLAHQGAYFLQNALASKHIADGQCPIAVQKDAAHCVQAWLSRQRASFHPWYPSVPTPTPLTSSTPQTPPPGSSTSHRGLCKSGIKPHLQSCLAYPHLFPHPKHFSMRHQQKDQQEVMSLVQLVCMLGIESRACPSTGCLKGLEEGWQAVGRAVSELLRGYPSWCPSRAWRKALSR